jgi:hypothetical protein
MIISLHKNNFTPFNLGLALQLYHGYGSKHLIETLHAFKERIVAIADRISLLKQLIE